MKKLIAQRPIQYMGRTYKRGEAIPAQNPKMVTAWLKAGSAIWAGDTTKNVLAKAVQEAARHSRVNDMAAETIRALGVTIEDAAGKFVGAASMEEQIRAIFAGSRESVEDGGDGEEGQEPTEGGNPGQNGQETPEEAENSESGGAPPIAGISLLTGHLDAADLEKWRKGDLEKLAEKMGVDISKARNNAERATILAAVEVQAPAEDADTGEALPELGAEAPVV